MIKILTKKTCIINFKIVWNFAFIKLISIFEFNNVFVWIWFFKIVQTRKFAHKYQIFFFFFTLISKFLINNLIICFSNNFFVNNLCATKTYAINFFKINVIFAFFIFFINSSLFSIDFQKFVNLKRKKIFDLRILNETTKLIFSTIFCNENTSNFVTTTIIFFFWFLKFFSFSHYIRIFSKHFSLKLIFIF